ncbi:MAG: winged helix-turn-helix domain-containing protein [Myxococcota bacterium]
MEPIGLLHLGSFSVDLGAQCVRSPSGEERISKLEADLLAYLASRRGETVSRKTLLTEVWGYHERAVTRAVDHSVARLRRKIEEDPSKPRWLLSIRGAGYRLQSATAEAPLERDSPRSDFIGRETDLAGLAEWTATPGLVTIHGPAGVGKTRLCREYVRSVTHDRVAFVELRGTRSASDVEEAVARALEADLPAAEGAAPWLALVLAHRASQQRFDLILDNAEHVLEPVQILLRAIHDRTLNTGLRVVVTSRRPLSLPHERRFLLKPLRPASAADLLVIRARQVRWNYAPDDRERLQSLAVEQLDGLPLAIELAASRLAHFGVDRLVDQLSDRAKALQGRRGDALWESLDAALAWSWQGLDPADRQAMSACAVFEGSFGVDAAEHVMGEEPTGRLLALVDQGMVQREDEDSVEPRFSLLVSVRDFVTRHAPATDEIRTRHRFWFAERIAPLHERFDGPLRAFAMTELEQEARNLRSAFQQAVEARAPAHTAVLGAALGTVALSVGRPARDLALLQDALRGLEPQDEATAFLALVVAACLADAERPQPALDIVHYQLNAAPHYRGRLLAMRARLEGELAEMEVATSTAQRALEESGDDPFARGTALQVLAHLEGSRGSLEAAQQYAQAAVSVAQDADLPVLRVSALWVAINTGILQGNLRLARDRAIEALALVQDYRILDYEPPLRSLLAETVLGLGELEEAARLVVEASDLALSRGPSNVAFSACLLEASLHIEMGNLSDAERALAAVADYPRQPSQHGFWDLRKAQLCLAQGDREAAAARIRDALRRTEEQPAANLGTRAEALVIQMALLVEQDDVAALREAQAKLREVVADRDTPSNAMLLRMGDIFLLQARERRLRAEADSLRVAWEQAAEAFEEAPRGSKRLWRLTRL